MKSAAGPMRGRVGCVVLAASSAAGLVVLAGIVLLPPPVSNLICFHSNQRGHKKAHCPSLDAARSVSAPAPATLRITDGRQGRSNVHVVKSKAFQLSAKEARATLDVVKGMYLLLTSLYLLNCLLMSMCFILRIVPCEPYFYIGIV